MSLRNAAIATNRFGLGARPGEIREIQGDPRGWLIEQLVPEQALPNELAALPNTAANHRAFGLWAIQYASQDGGRNVPGFILDRVRAQVEAVLVNPDGNKLGAEESLTTTFQARNQTAIEARFAVAVRTRRPFRERLMRFWANHFTVSTRKASAITMPPSFERDVARAHVVGTFHDMLMTSSKHPAMLHYLDNSYSIGPNSDWGRNPDQAPTLPVIGRLTGLNENLAREILELHTLGVNGGYSQSDVRAFALAITGWQVRRARSLRERRAAAHWTAEEMFAFNKDAHEPGPQTVLGEVYDQEGAAQGEAILKRLSTHPATARFVAAKLVRHFVADDPPASIVEQVAKAFLDSEGDLRTTCVALVNSPDVWVTDLPKFKRPEEYLISAARALGLPPLKGSVLDRLLTDMGQPPYAPPGPDGWSDRSADWQGPDQLWKRLEWANKVSLEIGDATLAPVDIAREAIGPYLSQKTEQIISQAASPTQGTALMLVSPEFLYR